MSENTKNQDCEMNGEDFTKDVSTNNNEKENGGNGGNAGSSGTATNGSTTEVTNVRDDDRYEILANNQIVKYRKLSSIEYIEKLSIFLTN